MHTIQNSATAIAWTWPDRQIAKRKPRNGPITRPVQCQEPLGLPAPQATVTAKHGGQLALPLLVSAMLHIGLVLAVSSTLGFSAITDTPQASLSATLVQATRTEPESPPLLAEAKIVPEPLAPIPQNRLRDAAQIQTSTRQARFLVDPDLSILEQIPAAMPGAVSLRLYVTRQGNVERVTVIRSDPVPKDLLDGLVERFGSARLSPAMVDGTPTESTLEVTIRVDPGAFLLDPAR